MSKFILRFLIYFVIFIVLSALLPGIEGSIGGFLLLALILCLTNMLVRPLLTLIALPFNFITFGIASIFVNMLTLLIADAIVVSAAVAGFWLMALVSLVVMIADGCIRGARYSRYSHH